MSVKKFTDYIKESYEMDVDNGDMVEEHAKYVISKFIEDGGSLQDAFDYMYTNLFGEGVNPDGSTLESVIVGIKDYLESLSRMASGLVIRK